MTDSFYAICRAIGQNTSLIQGAGGNISRKLGQYLEIKASGANLADSDPSVFVTVLWADVLNLLERQREDFKSLVPPSAPRPSIETPLHVLMPHTVVIHAHCVHAVAHTVAPGSRETLGELLDGLQWSFVSYARPGVPLAGAVSTALRGKGADVLILEKHGVVVGAGSIQEAENLLYDVQKRVKLEASWEAHPDINYLSDVNDSGWLLPRQPSWMALATDARILKAIRSGPFCPDQVVFLGPFLAEARPGETVSAALNRLEPQLGVAPGFLLFPHKGILISPTLSPAGEAMLGALFEVASRIIDADSVVGLSSHDITALTGWEAERYRQTLTLEK